MANQRSFSKAWLSRFAVNTGLPHQRRGPAGEAGAQRAVGKRRVLDMILEVVEKLLREVVILDARQRQTSEC